MMQSKLLTKSKAHVVGKRAGSLTVLGIPFSVRVDTGRREVFVIVECDCGEILARRLNNLQEHWNKKREYAACRKCLINRTIKHGDTIRNEDGTNNRSRLYSIWAGMRHRCSSPNNKKYANKGIRVCKEWNNFSVFKEWAYKNGYTEQDKNKIAHGDRLSIDRIDARLGYNPNNCRWVTKKENTSNIATERDKIIDLQESQLSFYEAYMEDMGIPIPDIKEILEFREILILMKMPKPWSQENKNKIMEYCNRS